MDSEAAILELEQAILTCPDENRLYELFSTTLGRLRRLYQSNPQALTPLQIARLRKLREHTRLLSQFIELQQNMLNIHNAAQCLKFIAKLESLAEPFHNCAVVQRIQKEIRELHEKLPMFQEREQAMLNVLVRIRGRQLENLAPHCRRGHPMVICRGPNGYFWGCSRFPRCKDRLTLSAYEKKKLGF